MKDNLSPHHGVRIGALELPGNLFLAPVAGYSDAAFRSVCVEQGADLCYTEMVSSEALTRDHPATKALLARAENEKLYAVQLFGARPETLAKAAVLLLPWKPALIDLNCGCPVPKIVRAGAGSALMRRPEAIRDIVSAMRSSLAAAGASRIPVTVKIRTGWDSESVNFLEAAHAAVEGGASAVTLHARTKAQGYSGSADWSRIAELASALDVPVFGSGDVFRPEDAVRLLKETKCSGVMVARGAMGNPFIFREARALLEGSPISPATTAERAAAARRHLELSAKFLGERRACVEFRKQFCSYTKGTVSGAELRAEAVRSSSLAEFSRLLGRWASMAAEATEVPEAADAAEVPEAAEAAEATVQGEDDFFK
ncbi:MAG TPA: tRNA dihydrouridine synthase DusB [Rectinemataceae bacterium]|nr:tRNA dihydrouridine synthase DusB [Rectinemataceae bacterium]